MKKLLLLNLILISISVSAGTVGQVNCGDAPGDSLIIANQDSEGKLTVDLDQAKSICEKCGYKYDGNGILISLPQGTSTENDLSQ